MSGSSAAPTPPSPNPTPAPSRARRWLRRLGRTLVALLVAFALLTVASVAYNHATRPPATLAAPDGADVTVDGTRVHYRQWGSHGPTILLVHGFAESTVSWQPMAEQLATDHRVTAVDLAGYGYTQYTGRYSLDDEAALVAGVVRALGLGRPLLVGHSLGAAVVGRVALDHPELISGVIFADGDALPFGDPQQQQRGSSTPSRVFGTPWVTSAYRLATRTGWLYRPVIRRVCGTPCSGLPPALADAWLRPMRQGDAEAALPRMAGTGMLHLTPAQIQQIRVPRGIIWGADDATGGGSLADTRVNLGHPAEVVIPGAGHLSMLARPAEFADAVRSLERRLAQER